MFKILGVPLFFSTLLLGVLVSMVSSSWFGVWVGMELNLLSFVPLIVAGEDEFKSEVSLKYFFVQAVGSLIFLQFGIFSSFSFFYVSTFIVLSLMIKVGAAPFHFWLPVVMEGLSWVNVVIISTVQKVIPLVLMSFLVFSTHLWVFYGMVMVSAIIGANGGVSEMLVRKLLAFSSINHMAWMFMAMAGGLHVWLFYLFIYIIIVFSVVLTSSKFGFNHLNQVMFSSAGIVSKFLFVFCLLSLGGFPPMMGFLAKWVVLLEAARFFPIFVLLVLVGSSLVTLFYYLRMGMVLFTFSSFYTLTYGAGKNFKVENMVIFMNVVGLIMGGLYWVTKI